ncbi:MAG: hypothetical protein ACI9HK_001782 [Pirellulaceae bacterium]|jgi:hypothetical protein
MWNGKFSFPARKSAGRRKKMFELLEERVYLAFSVISMEVVQPAPTALVALGSDWRYLDNGSDQGTQWTSVNFDDSIWSLGGAELGYGDGDEATEVGFGGNVDDKFPTTYFRHSFAVADPSLFSVFNISAIRDDGIALYLNGHELLRDNLPVAAEFNALADAVVGGISESTPVTISHAANALPAGLLKSGTNVLAAEIHQAEADSSDISFDVSLFGQSSKFQLSLEFSDVLDPLTLQATDLVIDNTLTATAVTLVDSNTAAFELPSLSAGEHTFVIEAGSIDNAQGATNDAASFQLTFGATPQYVVNQSPRLQLGNAPLTGFTGSELDQVEVLWQTISAGSGTQDSFSVEYRLAGSGDNWFDSQAVTQTITGESSRIVQAASIVGLNWDSDYEYRVRHLRGGMILDTYQHTFHTRLQAGDSSSFSFAAYGDSAVGDASGFREVQARVNQIAPAFTVLLGDNVYSSGTHNESDLRFDPTVNPEAAEWIAGHIDYLGLGNHDVRTSSGHPAEDNFSVPIPVAGVNAPAAPPSSERSEHNFSWDYGNVHFVTFDTNSLDDAGRLSGLLDWVVEDLRASNAQWKIVYGHHPVAGAPDKPENPSDNYYQQVVRQLNDAGVDLFMVGHSHTYGWTYPLTGQAAGEATFANVPYNSFQTNTGLPQLISGLGGQTPRVGSFSQFPFVAAGYSAATSRAAERGFSKVDVTSTGLTVSYIAADDGEVIDSFTITQAADVAPPLQRLVNPLDNSPSDFDLGTEQVLVNAALSNFELQLSDIGDGVDDATAISQAVSLSKNNLQLVAGVDYTFGYEPMANVVTLTPAEGDFGHGLYEIQINAGANKIADLAGNSMSRLSIVVDVDTSQFGPQTVTFQQGQAGYTGTVDTFLDEANPASDNSTATSLNVDGDNPSNSGLKLQVLLRFDDIFGSTPGLIPTNASLLSAYVELDISDAGDRVELHRMLQPWSDTDTWDFRSAGVQANDSESAAAVDVLSSGLSTGSIAINVTPSLQAWLDAPASNLGWAMLPVGTNGVDFDSSEGASPPRLVVNYSLRLDPNPPQVLSFAVNSGVADPANLANGVQPTTWSKQRSDLQTFSVIFSKPVVATPTDFRLVNLGLNADVDPDVVVPLREDQLEVASNELTIHFDADELSEGVYQLEIGATVVDEAGNPLDGNGDGFGGDAWSITGNSENRLYRLRSDFNADTGVSVFDFSTFSYWFGQPAGPGMTAPAYADMNLDGGVSVFDFTLFADNFGKGVSFPTSFAALADVAETRNIEKSAGEAALTEVASELTTFPGRPIIDREIGQRPRVKVSEKSTIEQAGRLEDLIFSEWEDWFPAALG